MAADAAGFKKGRGSAAGCVEGLHRFAQGATAALPLRVADCPSGNPYKVSVTDSPFCVIRYDKHSADWLTAFATPYPAVPLDTPSARGFRGFRRFKGFKGWWWRPSGAIIIHGAEPRRWQRTADSDQRTAVSRQPMPVIPPRAHRKAYLYRILMLP